MNSTGSSQAQFWDPCGPRPEIWVLSRRSTEALWHSCLGHCFTQIAPVDFLSGRVGHTGGELGGKLTNGATLRRFAAFPSC